MNTTDGDGVSVFRVFGHEKAQKGAIKYFGGLIGFGIHMRLSSVEASFIESYTHEIARRYFVPPGR